MKETQKTNLTKNKKNTIKSNSKTNSTSHNHHHHINNSPKLTEEQIAKKKKEENDRLYKNPFQFKFLFVISPNTIYQESIGLSLKFLLRLISIIYALRALSSSYEQIKYNPNEFDYNLIINYICIFTSVFLYLSIYKYSRTISTIAYYIFVFHLGLKIYMSIKILIIDVQTHNYPLNAFIGIILGLLTGSLINLFSTWIVFSHMVFTYNYKKYNSLNSKYIN